MLFKRRVDPSARADLRDLRQRRKDKNAPVRRKAIAAVGNGELSSAITAAMKPTTTAIRATAMR
jgi:hypothetical protein